MDPLRVARKRVIPEVNFPHPVPTGELSKFLDHQPDWTLAHSAVVPQLARTEGTRMGTTPTGRHGGGRSSPGERYGVATQVEQVSGGPWLRHPSRRQSALCTCGTVRSRDGQVRDIRQGYAVSDESNGLLRLSHDDSIHRCPLEHGAG